MAITPLAENLFRNRKREVIYRAGLEGGLQVDGCRLSDDDVADLASAPDGCCVAVELALDDGYQAVRLTSENPLYLAHPIVRWIRITDDELTIGNERFELLGAVRGQGVGALALALQVRACLRIGVVRLDAYAAGQYGHAMTGYYVWPRLGFDARVPDGLWQDLGAESLAKLGLDQASPGWVSDLMASPAGQRLWLEKGKGMVMSLVVEAENPAIMDLLAILEQRSL